MNITKCIVLTICIIEFVVKVKSVDVLIDNMEEFFFNIGFSNCDEKRKIFGNLYDQIVNQTIRNMKDVYLNLYTSSGTEKHMILTAAESLMTSSKFNRSLKTVIINHGYFGSSESKNPLKLAQELKLLRNMNVLTLDHSVLTTHEYYLASTNIQFVGEALGNMLSNLQSYSVRDFHLIGHSLGAHLSGFAGKNYKNKTGMKIQRISGLDPAGPCFENEASKKRLDKTDATFVDIIHTDMNAMGISKSIGHVDFFPNGGKRMPGFPIFFGHVRAFEYYIESVYLSRHGFKAVFCTNYHDFSKGRCLSNKKVSVGYWLSIDVAEGNYFLKTADNAPFALKDAGII